MFKDKIENHLPVHPLTVADVKKPLKIILMINLIINIMLFIIFIISLH